MNAQSEIPVSEEQIVEALYRVSPRRWGEVLEFLDRLGQESSAELPAPDIADLADRTWTAAELRRWPREVQDAVLREQAARLVNNYRADPKYVAPRWWQAGELHRLPRELRGIIMEASAVVAEGEYRSDPDLTGFEAPQPTPHEVWAKVNTLRKRLAASGRTFSDSAELIREDRDR